jgi:hypothetical protein
MAMINAKEAQQYVYSMFIDGMLTLEVETFSLLYCLLRLFLFLGIIKSK